MFHSGSLPELSLQEELQDKSHKISLQMSISRILSPFLELRVEFSTLDSTCSSAPICSLSSLLIKGPLDTNLCLKLCDSLLQLMIPARSSLRQEENWEQLQYILVIASAEGK